MKQKLRTIQKDLHIHYPEKISFITLLADIVWMRSSTAKKLRMIEKRNYSRRGTQEPVSAWSLLISLTSRLDRAQLRWQTNTQSSSATLATAEPSSFVVEGRNQLYIERFPCLTLKSPQTHLECSLTCPRLVSRSSSISFLENVAYI